MALANEAKQLRADTERLASRENADAEQLQSARQVFELQLDDTKQQLNLAQLRNGSLSQENRILYEENAKMAELLEAVRQDPGMQVGARSGPSMPALYVQFCDRRMANVGGRGRGKANCVGAAPQIAGRPPYKKIQNGAPGPKDEYCRN